MKLILVCLFLFFTLSAQAGLIIGGYGGQASDTGKGIEKLEGSAAGMKVGWRWNWLALEFAKTQYDLKTKTGQAEDYFIEKAQLKGTATDLILRLYLIRYLSIAGGITALDLDGEVVLTNIEGDPSHTIEAEGSMYHTGTLLAAGLHIPLGAGFEIFGEFMGRKWNSLTPQLDGDKAPDLAINEWHAGIVWQWGGGTQPKKRKKAD